jgi:tetratricopeptide (TPR) repeat protein
MASVYSELKRDDDAAIKELLRAVEVNPKHADAYSGLADIYRRRKDYPEAVKHLTTAIGISPSVPWAYKDLAKVYEAQGKSEDAIHYYEEAIKRLDPNDASTKSLYLGRIERIRGNYAEAIAHFQKLDPAVLPGQTIYEVGVVHVVSKNKKAAMEQYQQLVNLKSPLAEELLAKINDMK